MATITIHFLLKIEDTSAISPSSRFPDFDGEQVERYGKDAEGKQDTVQDARAVFAAYCRFANSGLTSMELGFVSPVSLFVGIQGNDAKHQRTLCEDLGQAVGFA